MQVFAAVVGVSSCCIGELCERGRFVKILGKPGGSTCNTVAIAAPNAPYSFHNLRYTSHTCPMRASVLDLYIMPVVVASP